jgi:glutamate--cysteine ligase
MSGDQPDDSTPLRSVDQLVEYFRRGATSRSERRVGTEHEKFVFDTTDWRTVSYDGDVGIEWILDQLVDRFGWEPTKEDGHTVGLRRDGSGISLEPGGQLELSGGVHDNLIETRRELSGHLRELSDVAGDRLEMAAWGMHPWASPDELTDVPKHRYDIMREYLPTRGSLALWMMKTTTTIQGNFDYTSEQDAVDLVRTAMLISPIVSAIFASSSIKNGQASGYQSFRGHIWTDTDPDRSGWPRFMYGDDWGFRDWVEYLLDVPMFFIRREGRLVEMAGHSFRSFMEEGHRDWQPTMGDFVLHMSTSFPEIRIKQFVEVRGADGGPFEHVLALPALWKGVLYDDRARRQARALVPSVEPDAHAEQFGDVYRDGLTAESGGEKVWDLAAALIDVAEAGLKRQNEDDEVARQEGAMLEPVRRRVERQESLADELRRLIVDEGRERSEVIQRYSLLNGDANRAVQPV